VLTAADTSRAYPAALAPHCFADVVPALFTTLKICGLLTGAAASRENCRSSTPPNEVAFDATVIWGSPLLTARSVTAGGCAEAKAR
jgi:hypothetical protein